MKKLKLALGGKRKATRCKTVAVSQPAVPASVPKRTAEKAPAHTSGIKFLGVGKSADGERFLKVSVGDETALLDVDKITETKSGELKVLTRLGEPLIKPKARAEFIDRAHNEARAIPSFDVATKTGWAGGDFIFPEGLKPEGESNVERYFDPRYDRYHRRLRREGSFEGWRALAELCRGKSRLMMSLFLALSGPVCGAFGDEAPGLQFVSDGGRGSTTIGRVATTVWGGDRNPARKIGCGVSCNNTAINFEVLAGAFDQMVLFLDDMHNAGAAELKAIHNVMNGEGRGRSTDALRAEYCTPMLCGANTSLVQIAVQERVRHLIRPLIDRLIEVGLPAGWPYLFEGIRTKEEFRAFGNGLRKGARENFGWAGPLFVKKLDRAIRVNRPILQAFVDECHEVYHAAAANIESSQQRDVGRISNKFATLYVTGCLAYRFKILPFTEAEVLDALLTCHRDHVAFIDNEMAVAGTRYGAGPTGATLSSIHTPIAGVAKPAELPFDRTRRFVNANRKGGFQDLRNAKAADPFVPSAVGYIGKHEGRTEYWIPAPKFRGVAGGKVEDLALKRELYDRGLLVTARRGDSVSYVVKRALPDGSRPFFVVLRAKARRTAA